MEIPVSISHNSGIACFTIDLTYDNTRLEYSSAANGAIADEFGNYILNENYLNAGNTIRMTAAKSSNTTIEGDIAKIKFKIKSIAPLSAESISLNVVSLKDYDGVMVPYTKIDGTVNIVNFLYGDASGDGEVEIYDAVLILRKIVGLTVITGSNLLAADADNSGNVELFDAVQVLRYVAGLPNPITPLNAPVPTAPTGLVVSSPGVGQLAVFWAANAPNQAISKYVVSVTPQGGTETLHDVTGGAALSLSGLSQGIYTVKVKAVNSKGSSSYCAGLTQTVVTDSGTFVFVKAVDTISTMGSKTLSMTVAKSNGTVGTYQLAIGAGGEPDGYLSNPGFNGWTATAQTYNAIIILKKVIKITLSPENKVLRIESIGSTSASGTISYDAITKTFSVAGTPTATLDASSVVYYWNNSTSQLTVYDYNNLPSLTGASGTYLVADGKVKTALFTNIGIPG